MKIDNNIGMVLIDYDMKEKQIVYLHACGKYAVNDEYPNEYPNHGSLWSLKDIETLKSKQETYKQLIEKRKLQALEYEKQEKINEQKEKEKNNLFGFTDNKTRLQAGKINNILQKTTFYKVGNKVKYCSRKDFIIHFLQEGYSPEYNEYQDYKKVISYNNACHVASREYKEYTKKVYSLSKKAEGENYTYVFEINKTEYDFAKYLVESIIKTDSAKTQ